MAKIINKEKGMPGFNAGLTISELIDRLNQNRLKLDEEMA